MGGVMFSTVLFCICVSLLSCRLCVTTFSMGLLFFCVLMCGSWLWLDGFFSFCELCKSCPFLVMVFGRELKKINTRLKKELSFWQCSGKRKREMFFEFRNIGQIICAMWLLIVIFTVPYATTIRATCNNSLKGWWQGGWW